MDVNWTISQHPLHCILLLNGSPQKVGHRIFISFPFNYSVLSWPMCFTLKIIASFKLHAVFFLIHSLFMPEAPDGFYSAGWYTLEQSKFDPGWWNLPYFSTKLAHLKHALADFTNCEFWLEIGPKLFVHNRLRVATKCLRQLHTKSVPPNVCRVSTLTSMEILLWSFGFLWGLGVTKQWSESKLWEEVWF